MYLLKLIASRNVALFSEPDKESKPPLWIRAILIATCTGVSYAHGSNDGQKGVGLMMILLMMFLPMHYALNTNTISHTSAIGQYMKTGEAFDMNKCKASVDKVEALMVSINNKPLLDDVTKLKEKLTELEKDPSGKKKFSVRKAIQKLNKNIDDAVKKSDSGFTKAHQSQIKAELGLLQGYTDWAPVWVILLISLSLGIGTMIGWKRIVVTIGEKIGKTHLTYAQGMVAEAMAASMIYFSTTYKLPVSTTHILSSSVAGTMVATEGTKNLQAGTIKNIGAAWVLTLPVTIIVSGFVYYVLQMIFA
jgi:PiT family inorganic phosphate transporter